MKKIFCVGVLFFSALQFSFGQNLVKNYSFEDGAECDGQTENIPKVNDWEAVAGRPRLLNISCPLTKETKLYIQGMKLPPASEGGVLAGIGVAKEGEAIQGELSEPLKEGVQYVVKMRVRLPVQFCNTPINEVGVLLSKEKVVKTEDYQNIAYLALALQNNTQTPIKSQFSWEEVSALYTAQGGEQYITIGSFSNINKGLFDNRTKKECSYLFIDVVSVEPFTEKKLEVFGADIALQKNAIYLMEEVVFEPNADILKKESTKTLEVLTKLLADNMDLKIELSSHVDNTLDESAAQSLTKARAKSLLNKMLDLGVNVQQVVTVGKGSYVALALNNTEKGRQKNNRVELKIIDL